MDKSSPAPTDERALTLINLLMVVVTIGIITSSTDADWAFRWSS